MASVAAAAGAAAAGAALAGVAVAAAGLHGRLEPAGAPARTRTRSHAWFSNSSSGGEAMDPEDETKDDSPRLTPCWWRRR
jgi:hypothetical protein